MSLERAIEYRFEARKCFEQAERAPRELLRARMKVIAEAWLKMAATAEAAAGQKLPVTLPALTPD